MLILLVWTVVQIIDYHNNVAPFSDNWCICTSSPERAVYNNPGQRPGLYYQALSPIRLSYAAASRAAMKKNSNICQINVQVYWINY
jgi:hypothetical protein